PGCVLIFCSCCSFKPCMGVIVVVITPPICSDRLKQRLTLRRDHRQQFVPGFNKRPDTLVLKLGREGININACARDPREGFFAVASIRVKECCNSAAICEGFESALGHSVDSE